MRSHSGGQSLKSGCQRGHTLARGSRGGSFLLRPAPGGTGNPWGPLTCRRTEAEPWDWPGCRHLWGPGHAGQGEGAASGNRKGRDLRALPAGSQGTALFCCGPAASPKQPVPAVFLEDGPIYRLSSQRYWAPRGWGGKEGWKLLGGATGPSHSTHVSWNPVASRLPLRGRPDRPLDGRDLPARQVRSEAWPLLLGPSWLAGGRFLPCRLGQ